MNAFMMEIGSEFWTTESNQSEQRLFISGRTALEFIIRDILSGAHIRSALLPSYCCHTMIEPFLRRGISVRFYDVFWDGEGLVIELPAARKDEILLALKYFGYRRLAGFDGESVRRQWKWIIEDRTHSWLNEEEEIRADYSFASYRKWTGLSGIATARKATGRFVDKEDCRTNECYVALRKAAREQKACYIEGTGDKGAFLKLFAQAEELLEEDYVGYAPALEDVCALGNLDIAKLRERRVENARLLSRKLSGIVGVKLMNRGMENGDVPLCVPVLVDAGRRDALRKWLIERRIYCPVHWPVSDLHAGISARGMELYGRELSLICDQRYGTEDMLRESAAVREFFEGKN